tara:strand:- start:265 stop:636 length:372 start_codon:yes stop_codon:yes gene_type:complete
MKKIAAYKTLGTNDLEASKNFYDGLFKGLDTLSFSPNDRSWFWVIKGDDSMFAVFKPYDGKKASVGNGSMIGFLMNSEKEVDDIHARAISLGATDDGSPGRRTKDFYGAYVRDLDGNKLVFYI